MISISEVQGCNKRCCFVNIRVKILDFVFVCYGFLYDGREAGFVSVLSRLGNQFSLQLTPVDHLDLKQELGAVSANKETYFIDFCLPGCYLPIPIERDIPFI